MTRQWQAGPHLNTATADVEFTTVSGTVSISSTTTRVGPYSIRTNPTATNAFVRQVIYPTDQSTHVYARAYARFASLPTSDTTIMRIADSANNPCSQLRFIASTGALVLVNASGSQVGSATSALSTGQWYRLELELDASSSPGTIAGRIDGTTFASGSNSSQTPWSRLVAGPVSSTTTDINWCDLAVNDTSGTVQNSWPDVGAVIALFPDSDGDAHGWNNTANGAGDANNWQLVDENPPNDTTDLVQTGTLNAEDMYGLTASGVGGGDTINCVMAGARFRNNTADATATFKVQVRKTSGGTTLQSSGIVPNSTTFRTNAPSTPRNYPIIAHTDPDGSAWTATTLDSMQAGVKLTTAGTNRVQVTAVWVSVDYTPSSGTSVSLTETGTGADAATTSAATPVADTAAGADTLTAAATAPLGDTAAGADSALVAASVPFADTAAAADQAGAAAAAPLIETGAADDALTAVAAAVLNETAVGTDDLAVQQARAFTDAAAAIDDLAAVAAAGLSDSAAVADQLDLGSPVILADSATGADAVAAAAAVLLTDAAAAADELTITAQTQVADVAAADDQLTQGQPVPLADTAATDDSFGTAAALALGDTGTQADEFLAASAVPLAEAAAAQDALTVALELVLADAATAVDALTLPTQILPGRQTVTAGSARQIVTTTATTRMEVTAQ